MRAVALHEDVLQVASRAYATNCVLVRGGDEAFVIDSPVFPDELDLLPGLADHVGFRVVGRLATHGDWDHLLAGLAFPEAPLGCAPSTADRLRGEPGGPQRALREFDDELYVERPRPLQLAAFDELPVPGICEVGPRELHLVEATGHTADGMAVLVPWARVLICGDYLSAVEIPMLSAGGSRDAYLATLDRLRPLLAEADHVVPGHGPALTGEQARAVLEDDAAYLRGLPAAPPPRNGRSAVQRRIHADNLTRL